jgi:imidazolonepropionase
MIEAGLPVALGSDCNPGTSYSENLPLMMTLACTQMRMTPAEALTAATINAAAAVGRARWIGTLQPYKLADLVMWDTTDFRHITYHYGVNLVAAVMKRGVWIHTLGLRDKG